MLFLYFLINCGLIILINPARQTSPFFGVTPYFKRIDTIFLSYSHLSPLKPELSTTSALTPSLCAILRPFASGLLDITTLGFIGIFFIFMVFKMASILLPLPEIKIARFCKYSQHLFNPAIYIKSNYRVFVCHEVYVCQKMGLYTN